MKRIPVIILLFSTILLNAQEFTFRYFYRVYFTDKGSYPEITDPSAILSERAINRRLKAGIIFPDFRDLPVCQEYISQIEASGLILHCKSKWLNTALFKSAEPVNTDLISGLHFVRDVKLVKYPANKNMYSDKLDFATNQTDFPPFDQAHKMINAHLLHNKGFKGKGILIAVNDGGFQNVDKIPSLEHLRKRKGIRATFDFVTGNKFSYDHHTHGTAVLSILAGQIDGELLGMAPDADYMLFRTEDTADEFPVEEDFWAAAAEYADSAGADIITSSLGYGYFDDPALNYKYTDLDGNSIFITRVADIAASKGILVFSSAGNERNKKWKRILAPSDGDSVICVGAVDGNEIISAFSSAGPSSDGRVKPDNSTLGVSVSIQISPFSTSRSNGTSFSCPVLSGAAACLLQAMPAADCYDIIDAIRRSGDRYNYPDSLYGYGIPDMIDALNTLQNIYLVVPENDVLVYPNPVTDEFSLIFRENPGPLIAEIFSSSGKIIYRQNLDSSPGRYLRITALRNNAHGIYFLRLRTSAGVFLKKIIKTDG